VTDATPRRVKSDYRIEALARGLRVLALFNEHTANLRLTDMASGAGILLPTTYRIARTLVAEGFLEQLPDGSYRPAPKVLTLGYSALSSLDLVDVASPYLQELADRTHETVNLAVLTEDRVLYLVRIRNADLVTASIHVGSTLPAVYTSIGKLLLAHLDKADLRRQVTASSFSAPGGPRAARSLADLEPELAKIRAQGYSIQDEEVAFGLRSIAVPIRRADGTVVAGVNIAVNAVEWPASRLLSELEPEVTRCCGDISRLLGYRS
jgi:IclR family transcriptional regulator, pca regulon regulatory protein